jgi:hypothetical protein
MATIKSLVLTAAAALVFTACDGTAPANHATAANTAGKAATAAPTVTALVTLEKSAFEAWKSKDTKFWDTFLSDKFVGYGSSGKLDKASATREYSGADCEIRSYALSDEQMKPLGDTVALITYRVTVDGTCAGQKVPSNSRAASVYVSEGDRWKGAFHAEAPIVDPAAAPAKPVGGMEGKQVEDGPAAHDARTDAMLDVEKALWEAWREHDGNRINDLTAPDISFINIFGTYLANKADALKDWTGTGCDVKSVSVTDAAGTMLSPTVGILTFRGAADGTCYGQNVGPIRGTSVYVRQDNAWKWTFGINLPAP